MQYTLKVISKSGEKDSAILNEDSSVLAVLESIKIILTKSLHSYAWRSGQVSLVRIDGKTIMSMDNETT